MQTDVPGSHPRYVSLRTRDAIVEGVRKGVTSQHGLIAHGRGEAFDYLLGEVSHDFALEAVDAAAAALLNAAHPVVSINGNAAALVARQLVQLAAQIDAPLEVNIFHASKAREQAIREHMLEHGATSILMPTEHATLDYIDSNRRFVNPEGILVADVIFVPLEDGDRCQALEKMGKRVITVDLNPLSRTSKTASITIVDNIVRCASMLIERVTELKSLDFAARAEIVERYDNAAILARAEKRLRS